MIRKAIFIGHFRPPSDSNHAPRAKKIYGGEDVTNGRYARYYEKKGVQCHITDAEWPKWRKVAK